MKFLPLLVLVSLLVLAQRRGLVDFFNKEKPSMGNVFGIMDELFAPSRHAARVEQEAKKIMPLQVLNEDDFSGKIEISIHDLGSK